MMTRWIPARRRLSVGTVAIGALVSAFALTTPAVATSHAPEPRAPDRVCEGADAYEDPWADVASQNPHYRSILCMVASGIAQGYGDGTYRPDVSITRAQMATLIANMIELERPLFEGDHRFDDVSTGSPHDQNIHDLARAGVVQGFDDGRYGPELPVRRDQMASFIQRAIDYAHQGAIDGSSPPTAQDGPYFEDVVDGSTHAAAVNALAEQAVVSGYGDGLYGPRDEVRRDQMASFVMRAYDHLAEVLAEDPPAA